MQVDNLLFLVLFPVTAIKCPCAEVVVNTQAQRNKSNHKGRYRYDEGWFQVCSSARPPVHCPKIP